MAYKYAVKKRGRPVGTPHTEEWKRRHSRRMSGAGNPQFGRSLSEEQWDKRKAGFQVWLKENFKPYEHLFLWLKATAKKNSVAIDLTLEQFIAFTEIKECEYCGESVRWVDKQGRAYNLDRKDNSLGYFATNCVVCCMGCNRIKSNRFSYEEMKEIGATIRSLHERRK